MCMKWIGDTEKFETKDKKDLGSLQVVCTPCQHFSGRTPNDTNHTLWASWCILSQSKRFWFGGDTGYRSCPRPDEGRPGYSLEWEEKLKLPVCPVFKEIGEKYGPFDLAAIPIGAYSPRWLMSPVHLNPEDSVCVHRDIRSKQSVGMHWGTFCLTDEPVHEPPVRLAEALKKANIPAEEFVVMTHGEVREFKKVVTKEVDSTTSSSSSTLSDSSSTSSSDSSSSDSLTSSTPTSPTDSGS